MSSGGTFLFVTLCDTRVDTAGWRDAVFRLELGVVIEPNSGGSERGSMRTVG